MSRPLAALAAAVCMAACATRPPVDPTQDPWLRTRSAQNCPQPACLFAIVVDSTGQATTRAEVRIVGTNIMASSTSWGRVSIQGIPAGSQRLRVQIPGSVYESEAVLFGHTWVSLIIELKGDSILLRL